MAEYLRNYVLFIFILLCGLFHLLDLCTMILMVEKVISNHLILVYLYLLLGYSQWLWCGRM